MVAEKLRSGGKLKASEKNNPTFKK